MDPEHYAIELIRDLGITSTPIDTLAIANEFDIDVIETDIGVEGMDGLLLRDGEKVKIAINNNIKTIGRKNFTLAHELGHYCIPTHRENSYRCLTAYFNPFKNNPRIESEANRFASELLLPESLIKPIVHIYKPDFETIGDLANDCGTSITATTIKYVSLTDECCAVMASSDNRIRWFAKSPSFNYFVQIGDLAAKGTLTASYSCKGANQIATSQNTRANLWVEGKGINVSTELMECCIPMPEYGTVLTLLWLYELDTEDCAEDEEDRYEDSNWKWTDRND